MVGRRPGELDVSPSGSVQRGWQRYPPSSPWLPSRWSWRWDTESDCSPELAGRVHHASPNPSALPKTNLSVLATGLRSPSALAITPDGTALIAAGNQLLRYRADELLAEITHDLPASETPGIIDLALVPGFPADPELYICYRTSTDIRVLPMTLDATLTSAKAGPALLTGLPLPVDPTDIGCQIGFGPDGLLYVGTSDGGDPNTHRA